MSVRAVGCIEAAIAEGIMREVTRGEGKRGEDRAFSGAGDNLGPVGVPVSDIHTLPRPGASCTGDMRCGCMR